MKVPSSFFANRASSFVLENLSTYEIAPPCPKYHPWCCWWWWQLICWWWCWYIYYDEVSVCLSVTKNHHFFWEKFFLNFFVLKFFFDFFFLIFFFNFFFLISFFKFFFNFLTTYYFDNRYRRSGPMQCNDSQPKSIAQFHI